MLHKDLRVDGKKLPNEEGLEKILQSAHFTCEIGELVLEVEFSSNVFTVSSSLCSVESICLFASAKSSVENTIFPASRFILPLISNSYRLFAFWQS